MNEYEYIYMKKRKDFGRYCNFEDVEPKILGQVEMKPECSEMYVEQTILNLVLDNIPQILGSLREHCTCPDEDESYVPF